MESGAVAELSEAIWEVEAELGLLEWQTRGVRLWEAGRMSLYYAIARAAGILETPDAQLAAGLRPRVQRAVELLRGGLLAQPFARAQREPLDALVFESSRAYEIDGRYVCPYTFALSAELERDGEQFLLMDRRAPGQPSKTPDPHRRRLETFELARALAERGGERLLGDDVRVMSAIVDDKLSRRLGRDVSTQATLTRVLARFLVDHALYRKLLARHAPRVVYCAVAYSLAPLMAAAREAGIRTVELQHGVISRYHLGYSYPAGNYDKLAYFPDVIYSWGEPWDTLMDVPVPQARLQPYGFRYFEQRAGRYRARTRMPGSVLVISQGTIGRELAEAVLRVAPDLVGSSIVYKLHPSEKARWREYPALVQLSRMPNVRIETDGDLYALMAEHEWQVGVYSTALYEGLALGLKTALVALPGVEYMSRWFERGSAITLEELPARLHGS